MHCLRQQRRHNHASSRVLRWYSFGMLWTRRKKIAVAILALLSVTIAAAYQALMGITSDGYIGHPYVVGLPPGYDPMAAASPYTGIHPSRKNRPPDPYAYPIPIGEAGPVNPTYTDNLEYPYACRTERSGLGQPLVDNQDSAGTTVYAVNDAGEQ